MIDLERLAREAADAIKRDTGRRVEYHCDRVWLERFAQLVAEEAAKIAADFVWHEHDCSPDEQNTDIAAAIRAAFGIDAAKGHR